MSYDRRGRKETMADPDMGSWNYGYNSLGELVRQTDAKGQIQTVLYDPLGRIQSRTTPEGTSSWIYDNAPWGQQAYSPKAGSPRSTLPGACSSSPTATTTSGDRLAARSRWMAKPTRRARATTSPTARSRPSPIRRRFLR